MNNHIYHESYLPVRFFLNQVVVHCPSCNEKAMITSDLPPVANQEKINLIFNDAGTFTSCYYYQWKKARFLCHFCQKYMETNRDNQLKTWHSSVICYAQTICVNCKSEGTKKKLFLNREYKSLQFIPDKIDNFPEGKFTWTLSLVSAFNERGLLIAFISQGVLLTALKSIFS